jgi:hypothetical protein
MGVGFARSAIVVKRFALAFSLSVAVACGQGGWPQDAVESFLGQCPHDRGTCECIVETLEGTMPFEEFRAATERGGPPPQEFVDAQNECSQQGP